VRRVVRNRPNSRIHRNPRNDKSGARANTRSSHQR
jgi:hypothetical protein